MTRGGIGADPCNLLHHARDLSPDVNSHRSNVIKTRTASTRRGPNSTEMLLHPDGAYCVVIAS